MKKVYVLLTKYSDLISSFLYSVSGYGYTHISLGLEESRNEYYSFNYKGFCVETTEKHRCRGVIKSLIYEINVSDSIYTEIRRRINTFKNHRMDYRYTRFGLLCAILQIPFQWNNHYICSQFVAELLVDTGAVPLVKKSDFYLPSQLQGELEVYPGVLEKIQNPI